ncbi:MAG: thiamine pyrophosphate-dependent dehydrogenase E1 component subunit alpha, partial [Rhodospirillales bacterium]|nr:thiamine pyrophosphate-dependent dehydrogenase E1 component subunit alpha [Rhodospirillales bacterium]
VAEALRVIAADAGLDLVLADVSLADGSGVEVARAAQGRGLPVLFVCEDNGFAATTRTASMTAGAGPATRARAFGIVAEEVDGNDILAVDAAVQGLLAQVRGGGGPRFLHASTYRLTGHTGADAAPYRPAEEVAARRLEEPIGRAAELLRGAGVDAAALAADQAAAEAEIAAAYEAAFAAPYPEAAEAFRDVQDVGSPLQGAF